jgi:hypothetical protein
MHESPFSCLKQNLRLAAPQGFEPRYADPESAVLPLNEGAVLRREVEMETPFDFMGGGGGGQHDRGADTQIPPRPGCPLCIP